MFKFLFPDRPFKALYRTLSPEEFVLLFGGEYWQVIIFLLSFCPRKRYVREVLRLLDSRDSSKAEVIQECLSTSVGSVVDSSFLKVVEAGVAQMLTRHQAFVSYQKVRRTFSFKSL